MQAMQQPINSGCHYLAERYQILLACLDWLLRPWQYLDSRLSAIRYIIAASSFFGGILFVLGSFAQAVPQVANKATGTFDCTHAWLVTFAYFIGTYLFTAGCFLLSVEAINREYPTELTAFDAGQRPTKPAFKILWVAPGNLAWWAGVSYTCGALLYNVGATIAFADLWKSINISQRGVQWLEIWPFFIGGAFFFISGLLYLIEFGGNPLRGMIPFVGNTAADRGTFTWWVNFANFWGGTGFAMSGFWNWKASSMSAWQYRIEIVVGYGFGAVMFTLAGLLLFIQMSLARCSGWKPSSGKTKADSIDLITS